MCSLCFVRNSESLLCSKFCGSQSSAPTIFASVDLRYVRIRGLLTHLERMYEWFVCSSSHLEKCREEIRTLAKFLFPPNEKCKISSSIDAMLWRWEKTKLRGVVKIVCLMKFFARESFTICHVFSSRQRLYVARLAKDTFSLITMLQNLITSNLFVLNLSHFFFTEILDTGPFLSFDMEIVLCTML